nr:hypothetical protein [Tanacetum cinerariifolium]
MIIYLKNMAGYKMKHFKGMTYDKVRPIFKREYNKVKTLFKPDKDVEEPQKKRVDEETLLQESFKKLKAVEVSDTEDVMWKLQRYMHYPLTWKLHSNCGVHRVSSTTRRHDMFMLIEKNYPLLNGVMTLMLSAKLQVEEDSDMARDLVMKIFMKANKPKSRKDLTPAFDGNHMTKWEEPNGYQDSWILRFVDNGILPIIRTSNIVITGLQRKVTVGMVKVLVELIADHSIVANQRDRYAIDDVCDERHASILSKYG